MSTTTTTLFPAGFADLERFSSWVLPTESARVEARLTRPYAEAKTFYADMLAEVPRFMPHLLGTTPESADEADRNLLALVLTFVEIANAVEIYDESEVPDGADLRLFVSVLDKNVLDV